MNTNATGIYQPEWVTKIEVARRQLCTAIRLFFQRRDPVAVHTLVAAGHQILTDLGNAAGVLSLLKGIGENAEHVRRLNYAANFFKHADRDPDGRVNIEPLSDLTAEFLMDAVVLLQGLTGELPIEGKVFWTWFVTKHRELFEGTGEAIQGLIEIGIDPDDFGGIVGLLIFHDLTATEGSTENAS
jgi:hypothetical protein